MKISTVRRLAYHRDIQTYLTELRILTGREIEARDLSSLDEVEAMREKSRVLSLAPRVSFEMPFTEKDRPPFLDFVKTLHRLNPDPVYVWTPRTAACGLYKVSSILGINLGFPFDLNHEGIFNLMTESLSDEIVFDFSDYDGERELMVELRGKAWAKVKLSGTDSEG
jgi:hypothetical protein